MQVRYRPPQSSYLCFVFIYNKDWSDWKDAQTYQSLQALKLCLHKTNMYVVTTLYACIYKVILMSTDNIGFCRKTAKFVNYHQHALYKHHWVWYIKKNFEKNFDQNFMNQFCCWAVLFSFDTRGITQERSCFCSDVFSGTIKWASLWENRSLGFPTRSDTNRAAQWLNMARGLKFQI